MIILAVMPPQPVPVIMPVPMMNPDTAALLVVAALLLVGVLAYGALYARVARIERIAKYLLRAATAKTRTDMATQQTLERLRASVQANTDATAAAKDALVHYAQSNADLTQKLQDALKGDDEDAVKAAADALEKNNAELLAQAPAVASSITANTPAASSG